MLRLRNIKKDYKVADNVVHALQGVTLNFRENEFVSVLGPSGCGKTTLLNIIGGLDHYTEGDLVICGKSTKDYKDRDWDVYRNHRIGFVFQSYNLIPHQTVLGNVELALTIAGVSKSERRQRAKEALEKVGLGAELHKRPNQLSGGQMQRVAIARALVNNPEILLADEPTGALDTTTSLQIMELIREIAGERLVIMVTHNPEIAEKYSSRIVRLQDGLVIDDTNPYEPTEEYVKAEEGVEAFAEEATSKGKKKKKEKAAMSFKTALGLSAKNLLTKKGRTAVTSIAGSIGIISVCLVLALSNGFNNYILKTEEDMLSSNPVQIMEKTTDMDAIMSGMQEIEEPDLTKLNSQVYVNSFLTNIAQGMQVENNLTDEYIEYLESMDESYYSAIQYSTGIALLDNLYTKAIVQNPTTGEDEEVVCSLSTLKAAYVDELENNPDAKDYSDLVPLVDYLGSVVNVMPGTADFQNERFSEYVLSQYDIVEGAFPKNANEAVLVVGENNDVTDLTLVQLGLLDKDQFFSFANNTQDEYDPYVSFDKILNQPYTLFYNDAVYTKNALPMESFFHYNAYKETLNVENNNGVGIRISAILRLKEGRTYGCLASGLNLTESVVKEYTAQNRNSEISAWMNDENTTNDMLYLATDNEATKLNYQMQIAMGQADTVKRAFGAIDTVNSIKIYTADFEMKDNLLSYLDDWNNTYKDDEAKQVKYTDTVGMMMGMVETMLDAITYVLVAFTAISLVVSSVMIGIITFVSVVERTKEIGVLRSLGARKRDIRNLFNAETFIIGLTSGLFGVGVTYLLSLAINAILGTLTGIATLASLPILTAFIMVCVSVGLTLISGLIPAGAAAKKDPVIALRTE
ncbi:MAG: ABC transporter ATP-binding protein/permease [Clostridia bacterium]|nr:ABC transporter ATP-binding protein/permease [Clostridia bacterium]